MGQAKPVLLEMTDMECGKCGIAFSVPETWRAEKQRTGQGWHCPNGCSRVYRESDEKKAFRLLKEEKDRHVATLARLNDAYAAEQKTAKELRRIKKRTAAGVCPCCNRTFQQLARHMQTKHPEVAKEKLP